MLFKNKKNNLKKFELMEVFKDLNNNKAKEFEKLLSSKFSKSKNISDILFLSIIKYD